MNENISDLIDLAAMEAQSFRDAGKGPPRESSYWLTLNDGFEAMKAVSNDFEPAYAAYKGIACIILDEWPPINLPMLERLGNEMQKW